MNKYFSANYTVGNFQLFSLSHDVVLITLVAAVIAVYFFRNNLRIRLVNSAFRWCLAVMLFIAEASYIIWSILIGEFSFKYSLPLHLCDMTLFLCIIMLLKKSYRLYEIAFFWGLGGSLQAIITPDLGMYSFPHFMFWQFFLGHGFVILTCFYMTFVEKFRPALKSVWKAFLSINAYLVIIAVINMLLGSNYMYICAKPYDPSLMDYLGPWPWYLLSLEVVTVFVFLILYLPFVMSKNIKRINAKNQGLKNDKST